MNAELRALAQKAGLFTPIQTAFQQGYNESLEAFARLVAEDCADECMRAQDRWEKQHKRGDIVTATGAAQAIRAKYGIQQ